MLYHNLQDEDGSIGDDESDYKRRDRNDSVATEYDSGIDDSSEGEIYSNSEIESDVELGARIITYQEMKFNYKIYFDYINSNLDSLSNYDPYYLIFGPNAFVTIIDTNETLEFPFGGSLWFNNGNLIVDIYEALPMP